MANIDRASTDPAGAIAALQVYLATDPLSGYRTSALRELEILRAKWGGPP